MDTATLCLCVDAPLQSWGVRSRFTSRDTAQEPTKSGVVGLLAAACGIPRDADKKVGALAELRMGVRVDREGLVERDFHTTGDVPNTEGKKHRTIVSHRYYLADAVFLVALQTDDVELLRRLHAALHRPYWLLYFGRRAFVPARPLVLPEADTPYLGIRPGTVEDALDEHPWLENRPESRNLVLRDVRADRPVLLRTVVDAAATDEAAEPRRDVPVSFHPRARTFTTRSIRTGHVRLTENLINAGDPSCT